MSSWADSTRSFVALDVEGTGMDPARHEIIEIAAVHFDRDRIIDHFSSLVRPTGRISLDIAVLTGIDPAELDQAPSLGEVAPAFRRFVAGRPIVGQSVDFDLRMLESGGVILANSVYDTYELATLLLPDLPAYNLTTIATEFGIPLAANHRALSDAEVTAQVFQGLLRRLERFDTTTLEQLAEYSQLGGWSMAELFATAAQSRPGQALFLGAPDEAVGGPHELSFLTSRDRPESLRRTGSTRLIDADVIHAALAPGGSLSTSVVDYERRPQQEAMAQAVAGALNDDRVLLVEAGTGTGKSLAYLLPAVIHAVEHGEPVVVSTNTLALQDQLYRKDLPDLRAALATGPEPVPFVASVLKGRSNYLCLRRWFTWRQQPSFDPHEARLKAKIVAWLGDTETGDRAELRLSSEEDLLWRHVSEEEGSCVASRCVFQQRNQCFLYRARRQAENSHLVIVNHALLLSDVMAGSRVLPEYERLIVDEAHHLEDQATTQFGTTINEHNIIEYLDNVVRLDGAIINGVLALATAYLEQQQTSAPERQRATAAAERLLAARARADAALGAASRLFARLAEIGIDYDRPGGGFDRTCRLTDSIRRHSGWAEVELLWEPLAGELRALDEDIRWYIQLIEAITPPSGDEMAGVQHEDIEIELGLAVRAGADLSILLQTAISTPSRDQIYWIERSQILNRPSLHSAPLHVGEMLGEELFGPLRSIVLTSATMTTDGTFDYIAERVGIEDPDELMVASPFDYQQSTLLYLADDMPEPSANGYQQRLNETLVALCTATRGRALVLFTSHASLQATARAIKRPLEEEGIVVLGQRIDGSPRQLIERLRTTPNIVVMGTATFWEGVDIVGPALSLLVITKLPFSVPADPVFAARSELFDNPFNQYAVPQAVLKFKQGFGRLIRSGRDRGVCAVLDRRLLSKRYGASFVQSLPDCSIKIGSMYDLPDEAANWLDAGY